MALGCVTIFGTKLKSEFPDIKLEYVGVDITESACKAAEKKLCELESVKVVTYCRDVEESIPEENFDLVLSASSFYYMKHPEKVLELCRKVISPQGEFISPKFWWVYHQRFLINPVAARIILPTPKL